MDNTSPIFDHAVIVGVGLLGASLGMAMRARRLARTVTGVGRAGSRSLEIAQQRGAIDRASTDVVAAVQGAEGVSPADLVVLCTPIRQFPAYFRAIAPVLAAGVIVTDVGSTKAQVMQWADELLPSRVHFIGAHPMAGSEKSGPAAAQENLYQRAVCMVSTPWHVGLARLSEPGPSSEYRQALARLNQLWREVGMRIIDMPADMHDRWVAAVSHLPHALAFTLVNTAAIDPQTLDVAAGGFLDTSRIASGDVDMWTDILMTNRNAVIEQIERFQSQFASLKDAILRGDEPAIRTTLQRAKKTRDDWIARRKAAGMNTRPGGEAADSA